MTAAISDVLLLLGAALILVAAIGAARFHNVLARMHALSKAANLGLLLVLAGGAIGLDALNDISFLILAGVFQILTTPVSTYLLGRATYRASLTPTPVDGIDELGRAGEAQPDR